MGKAILVLCALLAAGCASTPPTFRVLKHSSFRYPEDEPIKLYIREARDRSGGAYREALQKYDLPSFRERIAEGLERSRIKITTYNNAGEPLTRKLRNPFEVVGDSVEADMVVVVNVDGFEYGKVEVTGDRISFWNGFGISTYVGYSAVPRVLVGLSCTVLDGPQHRGVYSFEARGVAVNRPFMRENYDLAMQRCAIRFYEKLLAE